ncbi:MAG: efflux RND transporter periplasmic adaptor subunit [Candidatus Latescibacteria bacterium]|nr:efflux RND transporter periplasmic adaptor subunit [Candidatus Latescibacterota bacterium]
MNSRAKGLWITLGAIAVLAALALPKLRSSPGAPGNTGAAAGAARDQGLPVSMEVIRAERLGDRIATVGTVLPDEEVELRSEISGKVERIFFSEGTSVGKGKVLLKIGDAELQAQLLRARYRQAIAEEQAERQRQLFAKQQISQVDYDSAVNALNISRAEVQLIQAQLDKTEIRAPFAGVIGLRQVSEGSYLSPATPIATVQDTRRVKIDFAVPEKYAGALEVGDEIRFSVQGVPRTFVGGIYALETKIDQATRTLRLRALSPNPDGALIPGAFAEVEIVLPEKEGLTIPASALIPELKGHRVFLCVAGKAVSQPVEIGARSAERVAIAKGVRAGDTLITSAILQLRPGMAVRPAPTN